MTTLNGNEARMQMIHKKLRDRSALYQSPEVAACAGMTLGSCSASHRDLPSGRRTTCSARQGHADGLPVKLPTLAPWAQLAPITKSANRNNVSGTIGVSVTKSGAYSAHAAGRHVGTFKTIEQATAAYQSASQDRKALAQPTGTVAYRPEKPKMTTRTETEDGGGTEVIREALYVKSKRGHLGNIARDIGVGLSHLQDFIAGKAIIPPSALCKFAELYWCGSACPSSNALRQLSA